MNGYAAPSSSPFVGDLLPSSFVLQGARVERVEVPRIFGPAAEAHVLRHRDTRAPTGQRSLGHTNRHTDSHKNRQRLGSDPHDGTGASDISPGTVCSQRLVG